ncbi:MAG: hypothetical protein L6V88_00885 [Anaerotruncus sp.]|nr:MAG: hypothetical protein L6V88_00885 [Anaerotruncus sp.]
MCKFNILIRQRLYAFFFFWEKSLINSFMISESTITVADIPKSLSHISTPSATVPKKMHPQIE